MDPALRQRLAAALSADERVVFAYLFGSQATGEAGRRSDVDVAAWFRDPVPEGAVLHLMALVTGAVKSDRVDALVLNTAPLSLAAEVLKGELLVSHDEGLRVEVEASIMSRYHDRLPRLRRHLEAAGERLRERGWT